MIHKDDIKIVKEIGPSWSGPWIAGGAVLKWHQGESVHKSDIDVFFASETQFNNTLQRFKDSGWYTIYTSDNAITLKHLYSLDNCSKSFSLIDKNGALYEQTVQLIKRKFYKTAKEVIDDFDISLCQAVYNGYEFFYSDKFKADVKTKKFSITNYNDHILKRAIKYITYGYTPDSSVAKSILKNSSVTDFSGINEYDFNFK